MIKHMQSLKLNKLILAVIICFIIVSCVMIVITVINKYKYKYKHKQCKDNFEDNMQAGAIDPNKYNPPPMQKQTGCPNTDDLVSICQNYNSCCKNIPNTECYCKNPLVSICASEYDKCIADTDILKIYTNEQKMQKCNEQRASCCSQNSNESLPKLPLPTFGKPINSDQKTDES